MKKLLLYFSAFIILFTSCQNEAKQNEVIDNQKELLVINPYNDFKKIDEFLKELSEPSQFFTVSSTEITEIVGEYGTIIKVNPQLLITEDGLSIKDSIKVELIEMINNQSLISNNAQTISNGNILVTGGAYYINMISGSKQLKIKENGIAVEFPKLSDDEMELFIGERDSLNQMNWIAVNKNFKKKYIKEPNQPKKIEQKDTLEIVEDEEISISSAISIIDGLLITEVDTFYAKPKEIKKDNSTKEEYKQYLRDLALYNEKLKMIKLQRKTYEAVKILNFGWINCDRFYKNSSPKVKVDLLVSDTTISSAKFFAIFKDIKSVMNGYFSRRNNRKAVFRDIPLNSNLRVIGIAFKEETPYWFEKDISAGEDVINVDFIESTQKDIEDKIKNIN